MMDRQKKIRKTVVVVAVAAVAAVPHSLHCYWMALDDHMKMVVVIQEQSLMIRMVAAAAVVRHIPRCYLVVMESLNFDHMNVAVVAVEVANCHRNWSNPESKIAVVAVDHHKKVADVSQ